MKLATAETYFASIERAKPFLKKYTQDRPNPWGYHHQPSHERIVSTGRRGYHFLENAEKFALISSLLDADERPYPRERLNQGWEGLIYPDHGWCGQKVLETMRVFQERLQTAHDIGKDVYESSLAYLARRVQRNKRAGTALVVFNPLSWKRTGPLSVAIRFQRGEAQPDSLRIADAHGRPAPCQFRVDSSYPDGSLREAAADFVAEDVPPIGYKTYYLSNAPLAYHKSLPCVLRDGVLENRFYRMKLAERGIRSLFDKESRAEVFDTQKFLANELFMLGVGTAWGSNVFDYTFYPGNRRWETLPNLGRLLGPMKTDVIESGEVKTVIAMQGTSPELTVRQSITLYHQVKRIDFATEIDWKGIRKRELRLAFPIKTEGKAQISYDVPFGVVEVGKNEMGSIAPREVQNFVDVSDGSRGVSLAVGSNCLHDFRDLTTNAWKGPLVQPVLLSTLLDLECHGQKEHPWWTQPGHHQFDFALTTHPGTWQGNWRFGWEFSNPLTAVITRDLEDADVIMDRYVDGDPPEKWESLVREAHSRQLARRV